MASDINTHFGSSLGRRCQDTDRVVPQIVMELA